MNRRYVFLVLAYLVPTFLLGFVWHLVVFKDFYDALRIYRSDVIIPLGFTSMLLQGLIFAWAYPRLVADAASFASAARFSAGAALLSWTFTTLAVAAKSSMTSVAGYIAIETGFTVMQFALVAPLLALASRAAAGAPKPATA